MQSIFSNALSRAVAKHIDLSVTRRETLSWLTLLIMQHGTICLWRLAAYVASMAQCHQQTKEPVPPPSHFFDQRWRVCRGCAHQVQSKIVRTARSRAANIQIMIRFHFRSGSNLGDCSMAVMWDGLPRSCDARDRF